MLWLSCQGHSDQLDDVIHVLRDHAGIFEVIL